jgi:Ca2+-binding EF-hand superfamily protein
MFRNLDDNGNRQIDLNEFVWGLSDYGITLTEDQGKKILEKFDRDGNGTVNFDELLVALRGHLNDFRKHLIDRAYKKLDKNGDGLVTLEDVAKIYDASEHPDVIQGKKSP